MIDVTKLETFIRVAEHLSFSEAARQLSLTQPTVSYHIKSLEKELGVSLFERSGSKLRLSDAGRLLLPWSRKLVHHTIDLQDMISSLQDSVVGHLRIACSTTAGKYILPQLAARFCQRYPGIRISIMRCTSGDVAMHLLENEADLGVVSSESTEEFIEYQDFFEDSISLIVAEDHPWASRLSIDPEELVSEPMIIREPASGTRKIMLAQLAKFDIGLDDLNIFMELGNAEAIVRTVASGYAVSFVSTLASACPLERGQVVNVQVNGLDLHRNVYMVRKRLDDPHRAQEVFWSFVHSPSNIDILKLAEVQEAS